MSERDLTMRVYGDLRVLCDEMKDRHVGGAGNRLATEYVARELSALGCRVQRREFDCLEWEWGDARIEAGGESFSLHPGLYSLPFEGEGELVTVGSVEQLEHFELRDRIVLLHGPIAREQIMPKSFVFYNPEEHQRIVALLEAKRPAAVVAATGRNPELAGSVYPFPMFEDGDFDIPNGYLKDVEGERLLRHAGCDARLVLPSRRIPARAENVIGRLGGGSGRRVVVLAHIDTKKGTPGALDNGTGVAVLLALAEKMHGYEGALELEILAVNGEDYYSVPGQMAYLGDNEGRWDEVALVVNMDGAGYAGEPTAVSGYNLDEGAAALVERVRAQFDSLVPGTPWYQGDHAMFVQMGLPAIAFTSRNFDWLCREITHTERDNTALVDPELVVDVAGAIARLVHRLNEALVSEGAA